MSECRYCDKNPNTWERCDRHVAQIRTKLLRFAAENQKITGEGTTLSQFKEFIMLEDARMLS